MVRYSSDKSGREPGARNRGPGWRTRESGGVSISSEIMESVEGMLGELAGVPVVAKFSGGIGRGSRVGLLGSGVGGSFDGLRLVAAMAFNKSSSRDGFLRIIIGCLGCFRWNL